MTTVELDVDWPPYTPPEIEINEDRQPAPLAHSGMTFREHVDALRARKKLEMEDEE